MGSKKPHRGSRTPWMQEHLQDPYVQQAFSEGWRSRAVFKLKQIDDRDKLIRPGMRIVDLGAAPGGWSQYATQKLKGRGEIVALDILPMDNLEDVTFIQGDFTEESVLNELMLVLGNRQVDLVISDMAPNMSGTKAVDQPRIIYLAELGLELAMNVLHPDGAYLVKVFQGEGFDEFMMLMRQKFRSVVTRKPDASRSRSREIYLLGKGIRA